MSLEQELSLSANKTQSRRIKVSPWVIWGLGAAFFFSEYFARVSPSVMATDLIRDFHVNAYTLGSLSAFFYYAYVGMQVPVGMLVDRFGPHRLLTVMSALCAMAALIFSQAQSIYAGEVARFLMGFAASFAFVGTLKLASLWFPAYRFGLLAGMTQALGMLGAAVGEGPMAKLVDVVGWRYTMEIMAIVFFVLALGIGLLVRDNPDGEVPRKYCLDSNKAVFKGLYLVLVNPQSWLNATYAGLVYASTAAFAELWGVTYLKSAYNISNSVAGWGISLIFIGWGIGGPITGWISDRVQRRKPIMIASALCGLVLMTIILYVPNLPMGILFCLLFLYGMTNTGVATAYAVAAEINPHKLAGTSIAFSNMASVIIGACFQPVIGWLLDANWDGVRVNGDPVYSLADFHLALIVLPAFLALGFVTALRIKETYCQPIDQKEDNISLS